MVTMIIEDTVEPSCLPEKLDLTACALEFEHKNLLVGQVIETGSSDRPFWSLRTVSQSPEPPRQVLVESITIEIS